ncbi:MAG: hypothetical protein AAB362_00435 [Patescibacteria group bacterium]
MTNFEKDPLSHEANELFAEHQKEKTAERQREESLIFFAEKARKCMLWFLDQGLISGRMTLDDVLGILETRSAEAKEKIKDEDQK